MALAPAAIEKGVAALLSERFPQLFGISVTVESRSTLGHSGQNYVVDVTWDGAEGSVPDILEPGKLVVRCESSGGAWDNPREREFDLLQRLEAVPELPTARVLDVDRTGIWFGRPFFLVELRPGSADYRLFEDGHRPVEVRMALMRRHVEVMVALHAVNWQRLGLDELEPEIPDTAGRPVPVTDPAGREIRRIERRLESVGRRFEPGPVVESALAFLWANRPRPERLALVHSDIGPHNTLVADDKLTTLLDWEFAHLSDPLQDVAWFALRGRSNRDNFNQDFLGVDEFFALYTDLSGTPVDPEVIRYWQVLGLCRTVAGRAGVTASQVGADEVLTPIAEDTTLIEGLLRT